MTPSRRTQALEFFERLLDLPEAEREQTLSQWCGDDEELRVEVEALRSAEGSAPEYFDRLAERFGLNALRRSVGEAPLPPSIGPYRVVVACSSSTRTCGTQHDAGR